MLPAALIPWLDPENLIAGFGAFALLGVCLIVFAETGLLFGFLFPGDTLLIITGLLTFQGVIDIWILWVCLAISLAAFLGGEVGYLIGHKAGPRIFERKESGFFSIENVRRTNGFFERFGGLAVIVARFVPIVRTFAPFVAGVAQMTRAKFTFYDVTGGALWVGGIVTIGYFFGNIPFVKANLDKIIWAMILIPGLIIMVGAWKARRRNAT